MIESRASEAPQADRLAFLTGAPVAHRGFHGPGVPENSLAAIEAAVAAGFAVEVDLQSSRDHVPVVFHDFRLERLTGEAGPLAARDACELSVLRLLGTEERIPALSDMLDLVRGRVPILLEVKTESLRPGPFESAIAAAMATYSGPLAVMSFNPVAAGYFAHAAPDIPRGQVSCRYTDWGKAAGSVVDRILLQHLLVMRISKPDFIAYALKDLHRPAPQLARRAGMPLLTWTVRSPADAARGLSLADNIIFEGFDPRTAGLAGGSS
ncbi:MAG: phosphodiesterase [Alphaproteobacteria bacterium]|nr:phosphodiesterase [Alphaproteobacteria bacterium]